MSEQGQKIVRVIYTTEFIVPEGITLEEKYLEDEIVSEEGVIKRDDWYVYGNILHINTKDGWIEVEGNNDFKHPDMEPELDED